MIISKGYGVCVSTSARSSPPQLPNYCSRSDTWYFLWCFQNKADTFSSSKIKGHFEECVAVAVSKPQKVTESEINHSPATWMQHNCRHQRKQPFYQSQQQALWRVGMQNTQLSSGDKVPLISTCIFHLDSSYICLAPGSNRGQEKEMLERRGGGRYKWVAHECQHQTFAKK